MREISQDELRRVFDLVQGKADGERAAILQRECGRDAELLARVEAMLAAARDARFLAAATSAMNARGTRSGTAATDPTIEAGSMPDPSSTTVAPFQEGPGSQIGPFKLLQLIGEGGFGTVYMAEQEQPVRRRVALKIIKLGMDTRQVIARFEAERQALAMMDHPNIAKVLDAGATAAGRPFFVMELVRGMPITEYCDKQQMSFESRLRLFVQVCNAVQHAHQKGIIHRDIKPSNVLVSHVDDKPTVRVIDFGIAKATQARLTEQTMFTEIGQFIGTPAYMSPEQADPIGADIDTRSDIYSLGVLLYELLSGTTPFDGKSLRQAGYEEMKRIIREQEPPRPSTRVSSLGASLHDIARQRATEPSRLGAILRGELDWIIMKALDKDRSRRYETANGLALDVQRFLSGEAVVAAPPSTLYRMRKFVRRHRGPVYVALGMTTVLILGLAGTVWQANIAADQRDTARTEAARADERARAAELAEAEQRRLVAAEAEQRALAAKERDRAVSAEAEARQKADDLQKVSEFHGHMLEQVDAAAAGARLVERTRARLEESLVQSGVPDGERAAILDAFQQNWGRVNPTNAAIDLIEETILKPAVAAIDAQFGDQPIVAAGLQNSLALRYHGLGLDAAALELARKSLAAQRAARGEDHVDSITSLNNIGLFLNALGRHEEGLAAQREGVERSRRVLGDDNLLTLTFISNLGTTYVDMERLNEAEALYREALNGRLRTLGENHRDTLKSMADEAALLREQGKLPEAEKVSRAVLERRRRALGDDDLDTLVSMNDLGTLLKNRGKFDEATVVYREALERKRRVLGELHPSTLLSIQNLGATLEQMGRSEEAEPLMREALAKQQRLLGPDHHSTLTTLGNLCVFLINQGKLAEAEPLCRETLERRTRVLGKSHQATLIAMNVMGLVLIKQGRLDEGEPFWREALAASSRLFGAAHPETLTYMHNLGSLAVDRKQTDEAETLFRKILDVGSPAVGGDHPVVISATRRLARIWHEQKRFDDEDELLTGAEADARKAYSGSNERNLGGFLRELGGARARAGRFASAEPLLLESATVVQKTRGPTNAETRVGLQVLVDFYRAWNKAEPSGERESKMSEWQAKLDAAVAATQSATTAATSSESK